MEFALGTRVHSAHSVRGMRRQRFVCATMFYATRSILCCMHSRTRRARRLHGVSRSLRACARRARKPDADDADAGCVCVESRRSRVRRSAVCCVFAQFVCVRRPVRLFGSACVSSASVACVCVPCFYRRRTAQRRFITINSSNSPASSVSFRVLRVSTVG